MKATLSRKRGPRLTREKIDAIRADYLAGLPLRKIGEKNGVRGGGFHRVLDGLPRRRMVQ